MFHSRAAAILVILLALASLSSAVDHKKFETAPTSDAADRIPAELTHWITTASGVRHNKSCRWYKNSKGRMCTKDEGRACKVCGG